MHDAPEPQNFHLYPGSILGWTSQFPVAAELGLKARDAVNPVELKNIDAEEQAFRIFISTRPEKPPPGWAKQDVFVLVRVPAGGSVQVPARWAGATHLCSRGSGLAVGWTRDIPADYKVIGGHAPRLRIIVDGVDVTPPLSADLLRNVRPPAAKPQRHRRLSKEARDA